MTANTPLSELRKLEQDSVTIDLGDGKLCLVDREDYELVSHFKWRPAYNRPNAIARHCYARAYGPKDESGKRKNVFMHRFILNTPRHLLVDHINGNGLDNRRANLRHCNNSQNQMNRVKKDGADTSSFKGVYKPTSGHGYVATMLSTYLGRSPSEPLAALIYDKAALQKFGSFAKTNFPVDVVQHVIELETRLAALTSESGD